MGFSIVVLAGRYNLAGRYLQTGTGIKRKIIIVFHIHTVTIFADFAKVLYANIKVSIKFRAESSFNNLIL
jgi:hypothetical protein